MAAKSEHGSSGGHASRDGESDKGGSGQKAVSQGQVGSGKACDPNNFANDPERALAAGRKGGHEISAASMN
jgi:general stress protein YciG